MKDYEELADDARYTPKYKELYKGARCIFDATPCAILNTGTNWVSGKTAMNLLMACGNKLIAVAS